MKQALLAPVVLLLSAALLASSPARAVDENAAKAVAKRNDCFKCHAIDKSKKGPSFQKIAEKYKGKPDAESKLSDQITKLHMVKLEDGTAAEHKVIDTKDPQEIKNLLDWIRAQ